MSYLDHIHTCNRHDIGRFRPLMAARRHVGWVRHDVADMLAAFPDVFRITADTVAVHPRLDTPEARSAALEAVAVEMAARWGTPPPRGELYRVSGGWGEPDLLTVDRNVVSLFGIRSYGIHVNGVARPGGVPHLWIGRRAPDKAVAPGKLDNMIAGGQPAGLSLMDNLVKEAAEEAAVPADLARTARPVGAISYCCEDVWGLKPDIMFCYDLEVPPDFVPRNTDGEMTGFECLPLDTVAARVRDSDDFKFNVNLVITDFLVRHGFLNAENEPDYVAIVRGLRQGW